MNKLKLSEKTNLELITSLLNEIEDRLGFHPIDIDTGNCYFLFESDEPNTICHFHIKEIPGFLFALWKTNRLNSIEYSLKNNLPLFSDTYKVNSKSEFLFFTQFERDLDKFKPSRSGFVTGLYREVWEEGEPVEVVEQWNLDELEDKLKFMEKHFYKSYVYIGAQMDGIWEEKSGFKCFKTYIKDTYYYNKYRRKEESDLKYTLNKTNKALKKLTLFDYMLLDRGDCWHPRYELFIRRCVDGYSKKLQHQQNIIDKLDVNETIFSNMSIYQYEYTLEEELTKEEAKEDLEYRIKFRERFNRCLSVYENPGEDDSTIIKYKKQENSNNF